MVLGMVIGLTSDLASFQWLKSCSPDPLPLSVCPALLCSGFIFQQYLFYVVGKMDLVSLTSSLVSLLPVVLGHRDDFHRLTCN